jgi:hypothetical protein
MNPTKSKRDGIAAMKRALIPAVLAAVAAFAVAAPPAASADSCPNTAFRTDAAANLPDCRAYELVSHGDGDFGDVLRVLGSSDSGGQVAYDATGATDSSLSSLLLSSTVGSRSPAGWGLVPSDPIAPQMTAGQPRIVQPLAISSDFSKLLIQSGASLVPEDGDGGSSDLYVVEIPTGRVTMVSIGDTRPDLNAGSIPHLAGASRDLSRIYFRMDAESLISGAPTEALYEWDNGQLEPASVLPGTSTVVVAEPASLAHDRSGFDNSFLAQGAVLAHGGPHVVSDDGSTFFFVTNGSELYGRRNGATIQVNASQRSGGSAGGLVTFVGASRDGNAVYFVSNDQLTNAATPGGGLYRYELPSGELEQVTPGAGPAGLGASDALISDDASHVYFIATARLAPGAQEGVPNAYVYSDGQTRYIATIPQGGTVQRASVDGRFAILQSTSSLGGAVTNGHVALYEYDDQSGQIGCVSCRADGSPSQGDATVDDLQPEGLGTFNQQASPRNITNDGRVFFASSDQLVSGDVNKAWDVYEYENGGVSLLSNGRGQYDSYVADNSDNGEDAFFVTRSPLLPEDQDSGLADIYDARSGGGFSPSQDEEGASCGESCQGRAGPPVFPGVGSVGFEGDGNAKGTRKPSVSVSGPRSVTGTVANLKVKVPAVGVIALSGPSVVGVKRTTAKAATYTVKVSLDSKGKAALKKKSIIKVSVTVAFERGDGSSAVKKLTMTFRQLNVAKGSAPTTTSRRGSNGGR